MTEETHRTIKLAATIDEYSNFFNNNWGECIYKLTKNKIKLSKIVTDLMMEWRAAAYTASLPVSILEHMKAYHEGFVKTGEINTTILRLADLLLAKLSQNIPELSKDPSLNKRLHVEFVKMGFEMAEIDKKTKLDFPMEEVWESYLKEHAFQLSLWGTQQFCYVSVYNSYETFLSRMVSTAKSSDSCRTSDSKNFKKYFSGSFGESLKEKCWTANDINIARLARHAISHAGGRVTKDLGKQKHGFDIRDDHIQIVPEKTKVLFSLLSDCVYSLAEKAITMPEFD